MMIELTLGRYIAASIVITALVVFTLYRSARAVAKYETLRLEYKTLGATLDGIDFENIKATVDEVNVDNGAIADGVVERLLGSTLCKDIAYAVNQDIDVNGIGEAMAQSIPACDEYPGLTDDDLTRIEGIINECGLPGVRSETPTDGPPDVMKAVTALGTVTDLIVAQNAELTAAKQESDERLNRIKTLSKFVNDSHKLEEERKAAKEAAEAPDP